MHKLIGKIWQKIWKVWNIGYFQRKHLYSEMTFSLNLYFLNWKISSRQNVLFQIKQNASAWTKGIFCISPTSSFSPCILFAVSCQLPLIYLCIKWCNCSCSLFIKPEKRAIIFSTCGSWQVLAVLLAKFPPTQKGTELHLVDVQQILLHL